MTHHDFISLPRPRPFYITAVWRAMCMFLQTTEVLLKQE